MITDALLQMSVAQGSITTAATYLSTNTIDLGVARDIGSGQSLFVLFSIDTAFASGTAVQFQIITSAAANLSSPTVLASTAAIPDATLVAGYSFVMPVPPVVGSGQRYLGVQYVTTGTHTTGAVTAQIVIGYVDVNYYARGYSQTL